MNTPASMTFDVFRTEAYLAKADELERASDKFEEDWL